MANRPRAVASLKVLFIGNSFTARNDLPELIAGLAEARGKTFHHNIIVVGAVRRFVPTGMRAKLRRQ